MCLPLLHQYYIDSKSNEMRPRCVYQYFICTILTVKVMRWDLGVSTITSSVLYWQMWFHMLERVETISIKLNCDFVFVLFCCFLLLFYLWQDICWNYLCFPLTVVDRHIRNTQFLVALILFRNPFYLLVKPDFNVSQSYYLNQIVSQ